MHKILQRGHRPPAPAAEHATTTPGIAAHLPQLSTDQWLAAALGEGHDHVELDPAFTLDPTYEQPLWRHLATQHPRLARYCHPQAPLEALAPATPDASATPDAAASGSGSSGAGAASTSGTTSRWVDFVLTPPWLPVACVLELDGDQHRHQRSVDADRDRALRSAGHSVIRTPGSAAIDRRSPLLTRLADVSAASPTPNRTPDPTATTGPPIGSSDTLHELTRLLHAPAFAPRIATALLHLLTAGHLPPAGTWHLELRNTLDPNHTDAGLHTALDLLAAVDAVWSLDVAPQQVTTRAATYHRDGPAYARHDPAEPGDPLGRNPDAVADTAGCGRHASVVIELDHLTPPHAALTPDRLGRPTAVVRAAYLPADLTWLPPTNRERRTVDLENPHLDAALTALVRQLFDHDGFRDGQLDAIRDTLAGSDATVLLPTGAGKSLIYQVAGLLRPGTTLIVDPIVALIDDQERRLHEDGIDRVAALHQARVATLADRTHAYTALTGADALFVFLTPERLQNQTFRDALTHAARHTLINAAVVDEAHCVSEWGHDFRTAYLQLGRNLRTFCTDTARRPPPLLALTGTASPAVLRDIIRELQAPGTTMRIQRPTTFDRANLTFEIVTGPPATATARLIETLTHVIPDALDVLPSTLAQTRSPDACPGLVFVPHVNGGHGVAAVRDHVTSALPDAPVGIYAGAKPKLHAPHENWAEHKARTATAFTRNELAALVATKSFGMGVDVQNIRYTIHVGFPSSIEAFSQEAGRAGRDGKHSHCVIVATPPPAAHAKSLLSLSTSREQRLNSFTRTRRGPGDDLQRQLFFLTKSFAGVTTEHAHVLDTLAALDAATGLAPGSQVAIPRRTPGAEEQEKALYRLTLIGLVDDYTVDHGAGTLTVKLARHTPTSLDEATATFVERIEPGKAAMRRRSLTQAPHRTVERAAHHARVVLDTLYAVVEPARVRALGEMYQLVVAGHTDADIRARILAYLSDGPLAGILSDAATSTRLDVRETTRTLDTTPPTDPREWVGAAARQLEAYPDHPILLLVRALGEALGENPSAEVVRDTTAAAFASLPEYGATAADALWLLSWAADVLRNHHDGRSSVYSAFLYTAWDTSSYPQSSLHQAEQRALDLARTGRTHPLEARILLARRLTRLNSQAAILTGALTGTPAGALAVRHAHRPDQAATGRSPRPLTHPSPPSPAPTSSNHPHQEPS